MSADRKDRGQEDRHRIDVEQETECRYWSEALGMSIGQLKSAIDEAGPRVEDVKRHLGEKSLSGA
jgi:hypothetical protein